MVQVRNDVIPNSIIQVRQGESCRQHLDTASVTALDAEAMTCTIVHLVCIQMDLIGTVGRQQEDRED